MNNYIDEQNECMIQCETTLNGFKDYTSEIVDEVKQMASGNTSDMSSFSNKVEILDNKMRRRNIIVEGLPEEEKIMTRRHSRATYRKCSLISWLKTSPPFIGWGRQKRRERESRSEEKATVTLLLWLPPRPRMNQKELSR